MIQLKEYNTSGIIDGSNLLESHGLVFQDLFNCNIVMLSSQRTDPNKVMASLGGF